MFFLGGGGNYVCEKFPPLNDVVFFPAAIAMVTALPNGALDRGEQGMMSRPGFPRTQYNMQYSSGGPRVNAGDLPQPPPSKSHLTPPHHPLTTPPLLTILI